MFTLRKPPIVEAWVGLHFEPSSSTPPWGVEVARDFLVRYKDQFPTFEALTQSVVQVQQGRTNQLPRVVSQDVQVHLLRLSNANQDRWIQLSEDKLIYNIVAPGVRFPGSNTLCDEAIAKFQDYIGFFRPRTIKAASLFYLDLMKIPAEPLENIRLNDYFISAFDVPREPFGDMGQYMTQAVFQCPQNPCTLILSLRSLPYMAEEGVFPFRMEWQVISTELSGLDLGEVKKRLLAADDYVHQCFRAIFTDRAWMLFDPEDTI